MLRAVQAAGILAGNTALVILSLPGRHLGALRVTDSFHTCSVQIPLYWDEFLVHWKLNMPKEMCPESHLPSSVIFPGGHKPETPGLLVYLGNVRGRCGSAKELQGGAARF